MTNWLPADIVTFEADALATTGLYDLLRRTGVHLHSATQVVGARTATAAEARELGEPRGAALLTMERETLDDHGTVVEFASHLYAASRYTLRDQPGPGLGRPPSRSLSGAGAPCSSSALSAPSWASMGWAVAPSRAIVVSAAMLVS